MYVAKEIYQTCHAYPSQWEGETECGASLYIRFRYGCLSIEVNNEIVFDEEVSDRYDGVCDLDFVHGCQTVLDLSAFLF